jgi:hypothetical protein
MSQFPPSPEYRCEKIQKGTRTRSSKRSADGDGMSRKLDFLAGSGEMGERIRAFDWGGPSWARRRLGRPL